MFFQALPGAFLIAQLVKNLPALQATWVRSLDWERSPGEGKGYPLQYSGLENSMDWMLHGIRKSRTRLSNFHFHSQVVQWERIHLPNRRLRRHRFDPWVRKTPGEGNDNPLCGLFAWKIPWIEEPGMLQFMGSQKVRHDFVTKPPTHDFSSSHAQM